MRYSIVATLFATFVVADIQELVSQIPTCAVKCLTDGAVSIGCTVGDYACQCGKFDELATVVTPCLATAGCGSGDVGTVLEVSSKICVEVAAADTTPTDLETMPSATGDAISTTSSPAAAPTLHAASWAGAAALVAALAL